MHGRWRRRRSVAPARSAFGRWATSPARCRLPPVRPSPTGGSPDRFAGRSAASRTRPWPGDHAAVRGDPPARGPPRSGRGDRPFGPGRPPLGRAAPAAPGLPPGSPREGGARLRRSTGRATESGQPGPTRAIRLHRDRSAAGTMFERTAIMRGILPPENRRPGGGYRRGGSGWPAAEDIAFSPPGRRVRDGRRSSRPAAGWPRTFAARPRPVRGRPRPSAAPRDRPPAPSGRPSRLRGRGRHRWPNGPVPELAGAPGSAAVQIAPAPRNSPARSAAPGERRCPILGCRWPPPPNRRGFSQGVRLPHPREGRPLRGHDQTTRRSRRQPIRPRRTTDLPPGSAHSEPPAREFDPARRWPLPPGTRSAPGPRTFRRARLPRRTSAEPSGCRREAAADARAAPGGPDGIGRCGWSGPPGRQRSWNRPRVSRRRCPTLPAVRNAVEDRKGESPRASAAGRSPPDRTRWGPPSRNWGRSRSRPPSVRRWFAGTGRAGRFPPTLPRCDRRRSRWVRARHRRRSAG